MVLHRRQAMRHVPILALLALASALCLAARPAAAAEDGAGAFLAEKLPLRVLITTPTSLLDPPDNGVLMVSRQALQVGACVGHFW